MKSKPAEVVGRSAEIERVEAFATARFSPRALVFDGGPGIGKSTLWEAGVGIARERGVRVVSAAPSGAEAQLSFAALIDLCEGLDLESLPAPQRSALEVALLRREPAKAPPYPHAIGLAMRNVLAAHAPVLVAIDDVQWLDPPSAEALAFAARRLEDEPVGFLLARRTGSASVLEEALQPERVDVGPLAVGAMRRLLDSRLDLRVPAPLLRRIVDTTLGNPLFALEVGRVLAERGLPSADEDLPVPAAVEDMLGTRVAGLPAATRRLLLAVALSAGLHIDELEAIGTAAAVEDALDADVLRVVHDRVDAAHPLLAAAALARARPTQRRALHAALAAVAREPERRALHLALGTQEPDAALAAEVAAAAARAAARGARREAVALAEQALRLTPADDEQRSERVLTLAEFCENAGERQRVTDVLTPELERLPRGAARVRAWILLAEGGAVHTRLDHAAHLERALAAAGRDPGLRGRVLALRALNTAAEGVERIREAEDWALEALPAGPGADCLALRALGWTRTLRGMPVDDVYAHFTALTAHTAIHLVDSPGPVAALRLAWRGEIDRARDATTAFLNVAGERGEGVAYAWLRLNLTEIELRAGQWDAAERWLDEWGASDEGQFLATPSYQRCRALLAAGRGDASEAERWAAPARAEAEARGYRWQVLEASRALGVAALLAHDPARAAAVLRPVWEHTRARGDRGARGVPRGARSRRGADRTRRTRRGRRRHHPAARARRGAGPPVGPRDRATVPGADRGPGTAGRCRRRLRIARAPLRCRALLARARPRAAAGAAVARRPRGARAGGGDVRRDRIARLGRPGTRGTHARRRAAAACGRRADADRAAGGGAGGGRVDQQRDRPHAVRDRAHGRGASLEHVREARRPLACAAREPPLHAHVSAIKIGVPRDFAKPAPPVASAWCSPPQTRFRARSTRSSTPSSPIRVRQR